MVTPMRKEKRAYSSLAGGNSNFDKQKKRGLAFFFHIILHYFTFAGVSWCMERMKDEIQLREGSCAFCITQSPFYEAV